jgi:hypothetical protein
MLHLIGKTSVFGAAAIAVLLLALASLACLASDGDGKHKREWGETIDGQAVSIATDKSEYSPGERIIVDILYKNVGEKDLTISNLRLFTGFELVVLLPNGKPVPLTRFGQKHLTNSRSGSESSLVLGPGQQIEFQLNLTRLFDLTTGDKYKVIVVRKPLLGIPTEKQPTMVSNTIGIFVNERLAKETDLEEDLGKLIHPKERLGTRRN